MPSKSLHKVQKSVSKKKGAVKGVHVNSRDAKRLQRATLRDEKVLKTQQVRAKQNQPYLDRLAFLHDRLDDRDSLSVEEMQETIQAFINRRDEELAELAAQRRPGRPSSGREVLLQQHKSEMAKEHASGFWLPDMSSKQNVDAFRNWDDNWSSLSHLKFVRITASGHVAASDFPPRKA